MTDPVQLRDTPPLNDIPERLRCFADQIERGSTVESVLLIMNQSGRGEPHIYCFGENLPAYEIIGLLEASKLKFLEDIRDA